MTKHSLIPKEDKRTVLDSVLSDSGPMPAARLGIRLQAFILDWVFVSLFASIIIWKFAMPQAFPGAFTEMENWYQELAEWFSGMSEQDNSQEDAPMPQWSDSLENAMAYAQLLLFLFFWLYFVIGEAFFSGYTFGKSICRLRTISIINMGKPFFFSTIARAGIKSLAMLSPFILLATLIALLFNKRRQMGHDLLCRTAVVDERYLSSENQIK